MSRVAVSQSLLHNTSHRVQWPMIVDKTPHSPLSHDLATWQPDWQLYAGSWRSQSLRVNEVRLVISARRLLSANQFVTYAPHFQTRSIEGKSESWKFFELNMCLEDKYYRGGIKSEVVQSCKRNPRRIHLGLSTVQNINQFIPVCIVQLILLSMIIWYQVMANSHRPVQQITRFTSTMTRCLKRTPQLPTISSEICSVPWNVARECYTFPQ